MFIYVGWKEPRTTMLRTLDSWLLRLRLNLHLKFKLNAAKAPGTKNQEPRCSGLSNLGSWFLDPRAWLHLNLHLKV